MRTVLLFVSVLSVATAGGVRPENRFGWEPERAAEEAKADIESGALKIYYAGDDLSSVGVPPQLVPMIENLPIGETGITDTVGDDEEVRFRAKQTRYAITYNQEIVRHMLRSAKRDPAELERALADKKGQEEAIRTRIKELEKRQKKPNQMPEPTAVLVTPRAFARGAPSTAVAHL